MRTELQNQKINLLNAENSFNQICLNLKSTCRTLYEFENHLNFIKSHVVKNEKFDDNKRYKKLDRLVSEAKRDYNRAKIHNFTTLTIPHDIKSILEMGKNYCVGGSARGSNNYVEIQSIFLKFRDYCRSLNINETIIENVRCHSVLIAQDLKTTHTYVKE